jgi:hypothetical protein
MGSKQRRARSEGGNIGNSYSLHAPPTSLLIPTYASHRDSRAIVASGAQPRNPMCIVMIPLISQELIATAVQLACYFCTAVGLLLTFILAPRG